MEEYIKKSYSADFERIKDVLKYTHLSVVDFAKSISRSTSFFYEMKYKKNGRDHITQKLAQSICDTYPEISIDWLLNGTGEMLKPSKTKKIATASNNSTAVAGNNNVIDSNQNIASLIAIIKEKDDIIKKKDELIEKLISQLNQNS